MSAINRPSRLHLVLFFLILAAALTARLANLPAESLDGDEVFTLGVATAPTLSAAMQAIHEDLVHPPLYYLVARASTQMTDAGDFGLRLPSLVFGLLSIALLWPIGRQMEGLESAAMLAAGLLAFHHWHIFYSQQARSYALFCFLTSLLALWALRVNRAPAPSWLLAAAFPLAAALAYTHYVGALTALLVAGAVWLGPSASRKTAAAFAAAGALTLVPWLVSLVPVYESRRGLEANLGWVSVPSGAEIRTVFAEFIGVPDLAGATSAALIAGVVLVAAAVWKWERRLLPLAAVGLVAPALVVLLALPPFRIPVFGIRHLLPAAGICLLLAALGLMKLAGHTRRPRTARTAGAALLLLFAALPAWQTRRDLPIRYPLREAAAELLSKPLAAVPVYSAYSYGISAVLRHYLPPSRTIHSLRDAAMPLPPELLVFYRPNFGPESEAVAALTRQGYQVVDRRPYPSGARFSHYPERIHLRRAPAEVR